MLAHTQSPKDVVDQFGIASIKINTNSVTGNYIFSLANFFDLKVINTLPVDITIKADNFIDNTGSVELFIKKDSEETAIIYTNKPDFTATSNYPVFFDWNFINNEISVILR